MVFLSPSKQMPPTVDYNCFFLHRLQIVSHHHRSIRCYVTYAINLYDTRITQSSARNSGGPVSNPYIAIHSTRVHIPPSDCFICLIKSSVWNQDCFLSDLLQFAVCHRHFHSPPIKHIDTKWMKQTT
jgi:hypothetical protein